MSVRTTDPEENSMNAEYRPTSPTIRAGFATAAALVTSLVIGATLGLADHYSADVQLASAPSTVIALR